MVFLFISSLILITAIFPSPSQAVLPPDFIFNVTTQIIQSFSIVMVFLSVTMGSIYKFVQLKYSQIRLGKIHLFGILILIIIMSVFVAKTYGSYLQKIEYDKWLTESQSQKTIPIPTDQSIVLYELDNLKSEPIITPAISDPTDNANSQFIKDYYQKIASKNLDQAYEMSKKSVSLATFKSWYQNTDDIVIDKIVNIDDARSSLELTLKEGDITTRYGVLITLRLVEGVPSQIEKSEVKILSSDATAPTNDYVFFDKNYQTGLSVGNQEFSQILQQNRNGIVILDARENLEYDNGHISDGLHIRFADLKAGRWIELPADKVVYVFCWSGIRGKEVAEFLRTKKIISRYIENGANGWVEFGGEWQGSIKFSDKYNEYRFQRILTTDEVRQNVASGMVLIDSREPDKYKESHIAGSYNIPTMYIPSIRYEEVMSQIPAGSKVIAICDGYVNCFDAKITGVELEKRGHTFIGRYNKPWEYGP